MARSFCNFRFKGSHLFIFNLILLPITNYQLPITNYQLLITNYQLPKFDLTFADVFAQTRIQKLIHLDGVLLTHAKH
ncbi:hypothetical protein FJR08_21000 [Dolichospermum sp. UHCC 0260]|nr:hypothetical protein [Dolichospermum sp. UHCC 0352]MTJ36894.1 hypothetical protein [Dolichospermum sp. UHCC 0260]